MPAGSSSSHAIHNLQNQNSTIRHRSELVNKSGFVIFNRWYIGIFHLSDLSGVKNIQSGIELDSMLCRLKIFKYKIQHVHQCNVHVYNAIWLMFMLWRQISTKSTQSCTFLLVWRAQHYGSIMSLVQSSHLHRTRGCWGFFIAGTLNIPNRHVHRLLRKCRYMYEIVLSDQVIMTGYHINVQAKYSKLVNCHIIFLFNKKS